MQERDYDVFHEEVEALVNEVGALFLGLDPPVIGAALANLTAMWIVSHMNPMSEKRTERLRTGLLDGHVRTIRKLIPLEHAVLVRRYAVLQKGSLQ